MVAYIWAFLIIIGIVYSFFTGNINIINESILTNANKALDLIMNLMPIIVLWTGILKIAELSGLLDKFALFLRPILCKLFPDNTGAAENLRGTCILISGTDFAPSSGQDQGPLFIVFFAVPIALSGQTIRHR